LRARFVKIAEYDANAVLDAYAERSVAG
jgi:hypothetical protein